MKEYRVDIKIRNNLLLTAIESAGHKSIMRFCVDNELPIGNVYDLINMKEPPITKMGQFSKAASMLMEILGAAPSDLWSPEQLNMALADNRSHGYLDYPQLLSIVGGCTVDEVGERLGADPEQKLLQKETQEVVHDALATLNSSRRDVLQLRFGIGNKRAMTLEEAGVVRGVQQERIRQIENEALRHLRHSTRRHIFEKAGFIEAENDSQDSR